ncbi:CD209 antigen-like protein A [Thomomys bottae]
MKELQLGPLGCLSRGHAPLLLKLLLLIFFSGLLLAVLVQVFKVPSDQGQSKQEEIYQEMTQLKAGVDRLCRPCPWDWIPFQGNCYFLSKSTRSWTDSVDACKDMGAQLVVIKTHEEQNFLQLISKNKGHTWMGMSDLNTEATWHWVDGSSLLLDFMKYWNPHEPNNLGEEDCAEFDGSGWNDNNCNNNNFWICKKPTASCPKK